VACRLHAVWKVGESHSQDLVVALPRTRTSEQTNPWELLSVAAHSLAQTPELFEAELTLADAGGIMGPIHLPLLIHTPGVIRVRVTPVAAVTAETTIQATTYKAEARESRNYALWSVDARAGLILPLPQWVRGVGSQDSCTFRFLDRTGGILTTAIAGSTDRPQVAASVEVVVGGVLMFYY
jgi:hypothetical protein